MTGEGVAAVAAACASAGFILDRLFHPARKIGNRFEEFLDDWNGRPERRTPDGATTLEDRRPGVPERMSIIEATQRTTSQQLSEVVEKLNGGGLGSQLAQVDAKITDHITHAEDTKDQILEEVAAVKEQVAETQQFVYRLAQKQESIEDQVSELDVTVTRRLFVMEDRERTMRAALTEIGLDIEVPLPLDDDDT